METRFKIIYGLISLVLIYGLISWTQGSNDKSWLNPLIRDDSDDMDGRERAYDHLSQETVLQFEELQARYENEEFDQSLRQVLFIHRHGDRFIESTTLYEGDPLAHNAFWKLFGYGRLTSRGRDRMYRLGQLMQAKYGRFLVSELSEPSQYHAKSSIFARCIESGELFREGLLDLRGSRKSKFSEPMERFLNPLKRLYLPGSYRSTSRMLDGMVGGDPYCKKYDQELNRVYQSEKVKRKFDKYQNFAELIEKKIGFKIKNPGSWYSLNSVVTVENTYFPDLFNKEVMAKYALIEKLAKLSAHVQVSGSQELVKLQGGLMAGDILYNLREYMKTVSREGEKSSNLTRFVQYSTHDYIVTSALAILGALDQYTELTDFGSNVVIELHQELTEKRRYYVRIFYMSQVPSERQEITSKVCNLVPHNEDNDLCHIEKFIQVLEPVQIPSWIQYQKECGNDIDQLDPYAFPYDF